MVRELQQVLRAQRSLENDAHLLAQRPQGIRVEDIAALLGRDAASVADLLVLAESPRSLDTTADRSDEGQNLADTLVDEITLDASGVTQVHELAQRLEKSLGALSAREKEVLQGRFGLPEREPETLDVLSARLGLTRERVRQVQNETLIKLKRYFQRHHITQEALL